MKKRFHSQLKLRRGDESQKLHLRDNADAYSKLKPKKPIKPIEVISIDEKFISSDDDSGIGNQPVKRKTVTSIAPFNRNSGYKNKIDENVGTDESAFHVS